MTTVDPAALREAFEELLGELPRLRRQLARLAEEKPYLLRDLETARAALATLDGRIAACTGAGRPPAPRELSELGAQLLGLEARLMKMESTGLPRRDR